MKDRDIVELYWRRSEQAIRETDRKYGSYCRTIAFNILNNREDSEECVSDTWLAAWNAMPDKRPEKLNPFLAKIARNFALTRLKRSTAKKRGGGEAQLALEELDDVLPDGCDLQLELEEKELAAAIGAFVKRLPERERTVILDPEAVASGLYGVVNSLEAEVTKTTAELAQTLTYMKKDSPRVAQLRSKLSVLQKITGSAVRN